ncbi:hypothetical protein IYX23_11280 [Methylocystis sp. L43]|jgi:hypothetical protein|uniref:hypothetical protein n=1 Tax=unclassified Methylocystis TaxID=2625913 RepID=UPI0018C22A6A|nr:MULTISPECIES: hypothetical protein [unclassified Methylocystis]MBG0798250.1 hypothetical protein [Methylocystis sp. L43]MBG0805665.1 hypothetical protein [Methylocystis sp. H15]
MSEQTKKGLTSKVKEEARAFYPVFLYVWFLLAVLGVHKSVVLSQAHIVQHQGFAAAKALAFAKVLFVANKFGIWRVFDKKPLIVPILAKSLLFGLLLIGMDVIEQALLEHFWPAHADHDPVDLHNLRTLLSVGLVTFAALIPFFGFREFAKLIGETELRKVLFVRRENFVPQREAEPVESPAPAEPIEG